MTIQLDKILSDISDEKSLYRHQKKTAKEEEEAWDRVGAKNKLSGQEVKAIFKVLQKKYLQEKTKSSPTWKLFETMKKISEKEEEKEEPVHDSEDMDVEEDNNGDEEAFVELLEVREDEDEFSDEDDDTDKSLNSSNAKSDTSEKLEKPSQKQSQSVTKAAPPPPSRISPRARQPVKKEIKVLNSQITIKEAAKPVPAVKEVVKPEPPQASNATAVTSKPETPQAQAVFKELPKTFSNKRIVASMRKMSEKADVKKAQQQQQSQPQLQAAEIKRVLNQDALKRKLADIKTKDDAAPIPAKRVAANANKIPAIGSVVNTGPHSQSTVSVLAVVPCTAASQSLQKPASITTTTTTVVSNNEPKYVNGVLGTTKPNGINSGNPVKHEILSPSEKFDSTAEQKQTQTAEYSSNFGNFENSLPPTFFKNLCNSTRHEALGLYVSNVMNRLPPRSAAKLELTILKSIIEFQTDEFDKMY